MILYMIITGFCFGFVCGAVVLFLVKWHYQRKAKVKNKGYDSLSQSMEIRRDKEYLSSSKTNHAASDYKTLD